MARRTAQHSDAVRRGAKPKGKPRGRPFTGADDPRRNNGGVPKEARELKAALMKHGEEIVERFMRLVRKGNTVATVKAMEWIVGKPRQEVELTGKDGGPVDVRSTPAIDPRKLTDEQLEQLEGILVAATTADAGGGESGASEEESPSLRP